MFKEDEFSPGDRVLFEGNVSPEMREFISSSREDLNAGFEKLKDSIQDFVKSRTKIFQNLKDLAPIIDIVRNTQAKTKDVLNFCRFYEKTENNPSFSIYNLCGIEMCRRDTDPETDVYITDDDQMTVINSLNGYSTQS